MAGGCLFSGYRRMTAAPAVSGARRTPVILVKMRLTGRKKFPVDTGGSYRYNDKNKF